MTVYYVKNDPERRVYRSWERAAYRADRLGRLRTAVASIVWVDADPRF
jgi:hypothetical protein